MDGQGFLGFRSDQTSEYMSFRETTQIVHTGSFNPLIKTVKHERDLDGEQAYTVMNIVQFFTSNIHLGHNEVTCAGQKLYRYTKFGNTLKKPYFLKIPPKIHIGENSYSSNEFGKILTFLQQIT